MAGLGPTIHVFPVPRPAAAPNFRSRLTTVPQRAGAHHRNMKIPAHRVMAGLGPAIHAFPAPWPAALPPIFVAVPSAFAAVYFSRQRRRAPRLICHSTHWRILHPLLAIRLEQLHQFLRGLLRALDQLLLVMRDGVRLDQVALVMLAE